MTTFSRSNDTSEEGYYSVIKCPQCATNVLSSETSCRYCGVDLKFRVCPYCKTEIPEEWDPCTVCGRWEPADNIDEIMAEERARQKKWFVLDLILFFFFILGNPPRRA